jgi:hypothetical protein
MVWHAMVWAANVELPSGRANWFKVASAQRMPASSLASM